MLVALLTCTTLPEPDTDEVPLVAALRDAQLDVRVVPWDDPHAVATIPDGSVVVVRSTWNYYLRRDEFLSVLDGLADRVRLFNPLSWIRENTDKRYLQRLAQLGFPVVPTAYLDSAASAPPSWQEILSQLPRSARYVVKPRVSAGSFETHVVRDAEDARRLDGLCARLDLMVQPYLESVDASGERALVCLAGQVSHAVRKTARFAGGQERVEAAVIGADERALAERLLALYPDALYARVDLARDARGALLLMELELTEPSLFLGYRSDGAAHFAACILHRMRESVVSR
jgi:glutathione synthase/RimK-type ligase-like ATP-grasp enzyme